MPNENVPGSNVLPFKLTWWQQVYFLFQAEVGLSRFSTCKENKGIYSALRLDKVFNVSSFLNTTVVSIQDTHEFPS